MKVWANTKFTGHWPVGSAAVVVADTPEFAAYLLNQELIGRKLDASAKAEDMVLIPTDRNHTVVLVDGNY